MNSQRNNIIYKIKEELLNELPTKTFVLDIKPKTTHSNLLFVSTLPFSKFIKHLEPIAHHINTKYTVSEDVIIFQQNYEIAYLDYTSYRKRIRGEDLYLYQNRSTTWSIGPWLIEGFWSNVLSSQLITGDHNLKGDKRTIEKNGLIILEDFLNKEISIKKKLFLTGSLTEFEKEIVLHDINIAKIRKLFASQGIYLKGFKDVKNKNKLLNKKHQSILEELIEASWLKTM
jgi:hypothetical protein